MPTRSRVALILAVAGLSVPALAQQQRDNGRALDRNPQVGSGGVNAKVKDVRDQIWFNNQIITGNAPAGKSFRGYVGYTAPNDFRGVSNDSSGLAGAATGGSYDFRRDSKSGAEVATGVRASDALRYQMALTTGQTAPSYLAGSYFTPRTSSANTGNSVAASSGEAALRSTSDFLASRALRSTFIGSRTDAGGAEWNASASSLTGLTWVRVNPGAGDAAAGGLLDSGPKQSASDALEDLANTKPVTPGAPPAATVPGTKPSVTPGAPPPPPPSNVPGQDKMGPSMTPTGLEARAGTFRGSWERSTGDDNRVQRGIDTGVGSDSVPARSAAHARAMEALNESLKSGAVKPEDVADASKPRSEADRQMDRMRRILRGLPPEPPAKTKPGELAEADPTKAAKPKVNPDATEKAADGKDQKAEPSPEILRALKSLGEKSLDSLTPGIESQKDPKAYQLHMASGQKAINDGRYFDAEDGFTRAIAAMPDDPMAKVGRIYAELGGSLFLSASTNLRKLIADHPEVVGMRFDPKLAPSPERLKWVAGQLRGEIDKGSTGMGLETSLLLAYLGRMTGDQAMTDEGLRAMAERQPKDDPAEAALLKTLQGVWGGAK